MAMQSPETTRTLSLSGVNKGYVFEADCGRLIEPHDKLISKAAMTKP